MKNKEFYKDEIVEIAIQGSGIAKVNNKIVSCNAIACEVCDWFCAGGCQEDMIEEWAEEECVELKDNPFELQQGDTFYSIDYDGGDRWFHFDNKSGYDRQARKFGNVCKDEEYMQKRAKEIRLYNLLSNFAYEVNDGWEPDWDDENEDKWFARFNFLDQWQPAFINLMRYPNMVYFKTRELAQRAIEEVIVPYEK